MRVQDHTKRENAKLGEIETRLAGKNGNKTQNYHFKDRLMLPQKKKNLPFHVSFVGQLL